MDDQDRRKRLMELLDNFHPVEDAVNRILGKDVRPGTSHEEINKAFAALGVAPTDFSPKKDRPQYQFTHTFQEGILYAWLEPIHEEAHPRIRLGQTPGREEGNVISIPGAGYCLSLETMLRHIKTEEKEGVVFYICIHDLHHLRNNGRRIIKQKEYNYLSRIVFPDFPEVLERTIVAVRALPELTYQETCKNCEGQ